MSEGANIPTVDCSVIVSCMGLSQVDVFISPAVYVCVLHFPLGIPCDEERN